MKWKWALGLLLSLSATLWPQKKPVTVDDLAAYRPPRRVNAIWRPDENAFAFVEDDQVRLFDGATRQARAWFSLASLGSGTAKTQDAHPAPYGWQNRRVENEVVQWFPDSKRALVQHQGSLSIAQSDGAFQAIDTGGAVEDPKLSPDGASVAFRRSGDLFVLNLGSGRVRRLTTTATTTLRNGELDWVYPEELDLGTGYWWSPDSRQLAYLQFDTSREFLYPHADLLGQRALPEPERYPQAGTPNARVRLGVVAIKGGKTRWMDADSGDDGLLARVAWLPDSSQVAVERATRLQDRLDLLFCNARSGAATTIVRESSKTWINIADNLKFLKSRPEFLWTSEVPTGYRHIYRYALDGRRLGELTHGDWQVDSLAAVDEKSGIVFYSAREAGPTEVQYYRVPLMGGERQRLTQEAGIHVVQASPSSKLYLDNFSNLETPPSSTVWSPREGRVATIYEPDRALLERFDLLPVAIVPVQGPDQITLYAKLIKPAGMQPGRKYPVLVSIYGGPHAQLVSNTWQGPSLEQVMAHRGYVVWQLDNRGSSSRGHAFEAPLFRQFGRTELADQRLGVEALLRMGFADPKRIGIFGWSYGGFMTLYSLLHAGDLFRVGVAGAPVTDFRNYDTIYTERYLGLPETNREGYRLTSNVEAAAQLNSRLLILHNFEDDNVLFQNTMQMAAALEKANRPFSMVLFPQKTHGVTGEYRKSLNQTILDFFDRNLRDANIQ